MGVPSSFLARLHASTQRNTMWFHSSLSRRLRCMLVVFSFLFSFAFVFVPCAQTEAWQLASLRQHAHHPVGTLQVESLPVMRQKEVRFSDDLECVLRPPDSMTGLDERSLAEMMVRSFPSCYFLVCCFNCSSFCIALFFRELDGPVRKGW
jgi:hypothetical protein